MHIKLICIFNKLKLSGWGRDVFLKVGVKIRKTFLYIQTFFSWVFLEINNKMNDTSERSHQNFIKKKRDMVYKLVKLLLLSIF